MPAQHQGVLLVRHVRGVGADHQFVERAQLAAGDVLGGGHLHRLSGLQVPGLVQLDAGDVPHLLVEVERGGRHVGRHPRLHPGVALEELLRRRQQPLDDPVAGGRLFGDAQQAFDLGLGRGQVEPAVALDLLQRVAVPQVEPGGVVPRDGPETGRRDEPLPRLLGVLRPGLQHGAAVLPGDSFEQPVAGAADAPSPGLGQQFDQPVGHLRAGLQRNVDAEAADGLPVQQHQPDEAQLVLVGQVVRQELGRLEVLVVVTVEPAVDAVADVRHGDEVAGVRGVDGRRDGERAEFQAHDGAVDGDAHDGVSISVAAGFTNGRFAQGCFSACQRGLFGVAAGRLLPCSDQLREPATAQPARTVTTALFSIGDLLSLGVAFSNDTPIPEPRQGIAVEPIRGRPLAIHQLIVRLT
ncbi:MAG: hypothetical protein R2719_06070 [Micropruina sp.]